MSQGYYYLYFQQKSFQTGCVDRNGKRPGWLEQGGQDAIVDVAVIGMAYGIKRIHVKVIPEAMMIYGVQLHARSAYRNAGISCR